MFVTRRLTEPTDFDCDCDRQEFQHFDSVSSTGIQYVYENDLHLGGPLGSQSRVTRQCVLNGRRRRRRRRRRCMQRCVEQAVAAQLYKTGAAWRSKEYCFPSFGGFWHVQRTCCCINLRRHSHV